MRWPSGRRPARASDPIWCGFNSNENLDLPLPPVGALFQTRFTPRGYDEVARSWSHNKAAVPGVNLAIKMSALQLPVWFKASQGVFLIGGVLLLLLLLMVALVLTESTLVPPLSIGLLFLVPPNALMFYVKARLPELPRSQLAMVSSICFFLWLTAVILILIVSSW